MSEIIGGLHWVYMRCNNKLCGHVGESLKGPNHGFNLLHTVCPECGFKTFREGMPIKYSFSESLDKALAEIGIKL